MRGKEGDICYEAELAYRQHQGSTREAMIARTDYMRCLARQYTSGQANLYELRLRVHNNEIPDMLGQIGRIHCANSDDVECTMNQMVFLGELDSDQDGLIDLSDPTPYGGNPPKIPLGDEDSDGVSDDTDECGGTPQGWNVNDKGCPQLILQAQSDKSFYQAGVDVVMITGKVLAPDGISPLVDATVSFLYDNYKYIDGSERDGTFEIKFDPPLEQKSYALDIQAVSRDYREIKPNNTTVNFSVRSGLGIAIETDKTKYIAGETIQISGKVTSPEPIGSDLDIQCEVRVYDAGDIDKPPYRTQRVPLSSDGSFSYDVPIYGPDEQGKWLESGELGHWVVVGEVQKNGDGQTDGKSIYVYRHHVDLNKATREYWAQKNAQNQVQTANNTQSFDRPSHGESVLLGPNTDAIFTKTEQMENEIKIIGGAILYLKKMRQKLSDAQLEVLLGNPDAYITIEGLYAKCTSINSSYILEADPATGTDKITVFHGPIAVSSPTGKFPTFQLEHGAEVIINAGGIQDKRSLSKSEQWEAGQAFVNALGGINPADLRHESDPYADELDPYSNYRPDLEDILEDYALYIVVGVIGLVLLILLSRRIGKGKPKVEASTRPAKKEDLVAPKTETSESEWEATQFCTSCGNVMPMGSKFCPSCGAKQD